MKLFEKIKVKEEMELQILGIPILQYGKRNIPEGTEKYIKVFPKSFEHCALTKILKFIPKDKHHDHIFVVRTIGLGEGHLLNYAMEGLEKKWKFKNPCFVSQRHIYKDMYSLYTDIPFYPLNILYDDYAPFIKHRNIKYKGKCFHIVHCTIDESGEWLKAHLMGDTSHLLESIKKWWKIEDFNENQMNFSQEIIDSTMDKIKYLDLNLDKFIFIVPESNGTKELSENFWIDLTDKLKAKGFDIFVNTTKSNSKYGKCVNLSISEALYLASKAKTIIALRCGFAELLAFIPKLKSMKILYTNFRGISSDRFLKIYTLKKYPTKNKNNILEYETDNLNQADLINKLLK